MRLSICVLALLSGVPALCAAQRVLLWGGAEIIGLQKVPREAVLEKLGFKIGEPVKQKDREMLRWCNAIKTLPVASVNCVGAEVGGKVYYVVEILESADADFGLTVSRGAPAAARVPPEAHALLVKREYRVQEIAAEGLTPSERVTPSGILVAEDPELRSYDAQLREAVSGMRERFVAIALDPAHSDRREAVQLLAWTGAPQASLAALYPCLLDPDSNVRNEVGRLLMLFGDRIVDSELAEALVGVLAKQLSLPSHADRTRALLGLAQVYARHPALKGTLRTVAGPALRKIAAESIVPNVGGEAHSLLAALGGAP